MRRYKPATDSGMPIFFAILFVSLALTISFNFLKVQFLLLEECYGWSCGLRRTLGKEEEKERGRFKDTTGFLRDIYCFFFFLFCFGLWVRSFLWDQTQNKQMSINMIFYSMQAHNLQQFEFMVGCIVWQITQIWCCLDHICVCGCISGLIKLVFEYKKEVENEKVLERVSL